ncbi:DUF1294 domain-containing protein [Zobellella sp. DQSA1]|uniref:DUF1294 domain-containing protein n=1 Tax=Zobellella sp. DQSA1 TaxID=3342386 RepID=UPI0035BF0C38
MGKRYRGHITQWKHEQGFGFITPEGGGEPLFVHIKAFVAGKCRPVDRQAVSYELGRDARGRRQAQQVLLQGQSAPAGPFYPLFLLFFITLLAALAWLGALDWWVVALYLGVSLFTYWMYGLDKQAARQNLWRTRESTLHLLALAGGWPGALVAQRRLRHKSRKASFQLVFWLSVVANVGVLAWLLFDPGWGWLDHLSGLY